MARQCWFQKPWVTKQKFQCQVCKASTGAVVKGGYKDPKMLQAFDTLHVFLLELIAKYREIRLKKSQKVLPFWLAFIVPEGAMEAAMGKRHR